jgi:hypothetical protein
VGCRATRESHIRDHSPDRDGTEVARGVNPWRGRIGTIALIFSALISSTNACEDLTVRDAAFSEPRDEHTLFVIANGADSQGAEIERRLADWLIGSGSGLNLAVKGISADDPETDWSQVGIPSAPPSLPVVVLAGNDVTARRSFYIQHYEPEPTPEDLADLETSPIRAAIRAKMGDRMAVILHVPGTASAATDTSAVLDSIIADWGKREKLAIEKLALNRTDANEKILVSFLGVPEQGPDWVGVVFGKGKIMPPLEGDEINEYGLNEHLAAVAAECTCLSTAAKLGVDIPMKWSAADDGTFQPLREPEMGDADGAVVASVNWGPMKSTGVVLGGLTALALLGGVVLILRRAGSDSPSLAR